MTRIALTAALAILASGGVAQADDPGTLADAFDRTIDLVLIQNGGQTVAMAMALGSGPHVATASHVTPNAISVGVIAATVPVGVEETETGFTMFTSPVGLDR